MCGVSITMSGLSYPGWLLVAGLVVEIYRGLSEGGA